MALLTQRSEDRDRKNQRDEGQRDGDWHVPPVRDGHLYSNKCEDDAQTGLQLAEAVSHVCQQEIQGA